MRYILMINKLYSMVFLAFFITACATTQEEEIQIDDPTVDITVESDDTGTMLEEGSSATTIPIAEEDITVEELLAQIGTDLANRTIYFEFDSAKLYDESLSLLEVHGNFIARNANVQVRLEGHADERGSREYNIGIGDQRAQAVRRALLIQGSLVDQIDTISYGEEQPAVSGHSEYAWSKNRRVEILYTVN